MYWINVCIKKIFQIPISWKQYDLYRRPPWPPGLGPRLVCDSDLELKKAERRGGSSWVTAGIQGPCSGWWGVGVRDRQRWVVGMIQLRGGWGGGWLLRYVGGCLSSWQIHIPAGGLPNNKDSGPAPAHTSFLDWNSPVSSLNTRTDGGWWCNKLHFFK